MIWRVTAEAGLWVGNATIPYGAISRLEWLTTPQVDRLQELGYVQRVSAPPIAAIRELTARAGALADAGVADLADLIEADPTELARRIRSTQERVRGWQRKAVAMLSAPLPSGG